MEEILDQISAIYDLRDEKVKTNPAYTAYDALSDYVKNNNEASIIKDCLTVVNDEIKKIESKKTTKEYPDLLKKIKTDFTSKKLMEINSTIDEFVELSGEFEKQYKTTPLLPEYIGERSDALIKYASVLGDKKILTVDSEVCKYIVDHPELVGNSVNHLVSQGINYDRVVGKGQGVKPDNFEWSTLLANIKSVFHIDDKNITLNPSNDCDKVTLAGVKLGEETLNGTCVVSIPKIKQDVAVNVAEGGEVKAKPTIARNN